MQKTAYHEVAHKIDKAIEAGQYQGRMPTIEELARSFSVSKGTMQRAIGVLKQDRKVEAAPKLGLYATPHKRARTHVIGAVLGVRGGFHLHDCLIAGLRGAAEDRHELLALSPGSRRDPAKELSQVRQLVEERQVDGVVIWPVVSQSGVISDGVAYLKAAKIPFVIVPVCDLVTHHDCNTVCNCDSEGARDVMMHLIGTGHRRIAFVVTQEKANDLFTRYRYDQYVQSMQLSGLEACDLVLAEDVIDGRVPMDRFTALFCATDECAGEVMKHCLATGIRVPADVAIAGYDNTSFGERIGLTSVEQHFEKIGTMAVDLLLADIEGELENKQHLNVKSELIIRESTGVGER